MIRRSSPKMLTARISRGGERVSAMQLLAENLATLDEAAWYAARIERLGRAMFGDLWDSDKAGAAREQQESP